MGKPFPLLALLLGVLAGAPAAGHRLAPSLLEVRELAPGELSVLWKTPLARPAGVELIPVLPESCRQETAAVAGGDAGAATLRFEARCDGALTGARFGVSGLLESRTEALLRLELADGRSFRAVLRGDAAGFVVPERERPGAVLRSYAALGFRHILEGADHLLFVLGLVLLVPSTRRLAWTVTAFTLGHSVTLSLAALGFVGLPPGPVELAIALTILLLALELARGDAGAPSLLRRYPPAVAGAFGLLHGLGFAGALAEIGLPQHEVPLALLSFNVGIELGQLAFVACLLVFAPLVRALAGRGPAWLARVPAYTLGSLAAFWCFERGAALL